MNLGAIIKRDYRNVTHKDRDRLLGAATERPKEYKADITWLERVSQKNIPACSSHAAAHLKMILDAIFDNIKRRLSPIFGWRAIKTLVIDGFAPSQGTTIEALFKMLKVYGMCEYNLLPTDFSLDEATQAFSKLAENQIENAQPKIIDKYAITYKPTHDLIRDIIWKDKAAVLLLRFDNSWWRSDVLTSNGKLDYGHFVCAYGYDEDYIYIIDSADDNYPYKKLGRGFSVVAVGSAVDLPDEYVKSLVSKRALLQQIIELYRQLKALLSLK